MQAQVRAGKWRYLAVLAGAVVVGGTVAATLLYPFKDGHAEAAKGDEPAAVSVTVAVVESRLADLWDEFSGRLEAVERVEVRPRVAGAIQSTGFTEGELVKAGELLFVIDPAPYQADVDRAQAQLEAASARVVYTKGEVERAQQLVQRNIVAQRDFDQRENAYREALANLKAAEAALQTAKLNLGYTEVRAPLNGRVGKIQVTVGNLVAAGTTSPILTTLVSVDPIYANFDADEGVVLRALRNITDADGKRGKLDQVPVTMTTVDGTTAEGQIQLIDNQVNGQSGTIRVRAVFFNTQGRLIPGQFARVRMGQAKQSPVLLVEERAIGTDQDKRFVLVVGDDGRTSYRIVTLGGSIDGLRVVTSGLSAGERIVVNGLQRVRPGALVKAQVAQMGGRPKQ